MNDHYKNQDQDQDLEDCLEHWDTFCDQLKTSGRDILNQSKGLDATTKADGLRYLTRLMRGGLEKFIEFGDPSDPILYKVYHERLKWGGDNPDSIYSMSSVSGAHEYQLHGNRGTIHYFNISSMAMLADGKLDTTGFIDCEDLLADKDGNFVIHISREKPTLQASGHTANWLPMTLESNNIMIRQTFRDRSKEQELTANIQIAPTNNTNIEKNASDQNHKALTLAHVISATDRAKQFFSKTGETFAKLSLSMLENVNKLPPVDLEYITSMGGDPNYSYFWSAFNVKQGQALLVHLPKEPICDTWSLCLHNYWLESLDYHKSQIILNKYTAAKNTDGSVTMVISLEDPGVNNWLDPCGHSLGQMIFRWTKAEEIVAPQVELVDLSTINLDSK